MTTQPVKLFVEGNQLGIDWSDGQRRMYSMLDLRKSCPCASCQGHHTTLRPEEIPPVDCPSDVKIVHMAPAGNYAYKIQFSDGHNTGIFSLELLRRLGNAVEPA